MAALLRREGVYLWYYFDLQLRQILPYWLLGSLVSVFAKGHIHRLLARMPGRRFGTAGIFIASALGIASPLCMYGTIPLAASLAQGGMKDDWLAAFMMSSILLNPQLIFYSMALGPAALAVRVGLSFLYGAAAGLLVRACCRGGHFFDFRGFAAPADRDTDPNPAVRLLKNLGRNLRATGPLFLLGVALSALFQRYVPAGLVADLFGKNRGFGLLMAATMGVPLYACGGGTVPLLQAWLADGMGLGSAAAFMITGPATKITNLGAVKIVLGAGRFALYLAFVLLFALAAGWAVGLVL